MRRQSVVLSCRPRQGGAVLVELALVLPLLLFMLLATVEFTQALAHYQVLLKQVRTSARYLSTRAAGSGHVEAECLLRTGRPSAVMPCLGPALLPGLGDAGVRVAVLDALNAAATHRAQLSSTDDTAAHAVTLNLVTVRLSGYRHRLVFAGLLTPATGGAATLDFGTLQLTLRQAS